MCACGSCATNCQQGDDIKLSHTTVLAAALLAVNPSYSQQPACIAGEEISIGTNIRISSVSFGVASAGCWAQLYDERSFKGDTFTMAGPIVIASTDKASGRQMRRNIDSLVIGPKATLTVFEHRMFKDRSVSFVPNAKEPELIRKLGFSGRIESMKLDCLK